MRFLTVCHSLKNLLKRWVLVVFEHFQVTAGINKLLVIFLVWRRPHRAAFLVVIYLCARTGNWQSGTDDTTRKQALNHWSGVRKRQQPSVFFTSG